MRTNKTDRLYSPYKKMQFERCSPTVAMDPWEFAYECSNIKMRESKWEWKLSTYELNAM